MPSVVVTVLMFLLTATNTSQAQDARELVRLPEPMQEHMLGNMRDHLATLNEIIGDVADGKFDDAAKLAEQRSKYPPAKPGALVNVAARSGRWGSLTRPRRLLGHLKVAGQRHRFS